MWHFVAFCDIGSGYIFSECSILFHFVPLPGPGGRTCPRRPLSSISARPKTKGHLPVFFKESGRCPV